MRLSALLSLVILLSMVISPLPAGAAPETAISATTRDAIIARATEMAYGRWVSPVTVYRNYSSWPYQWATFYKGTTYTGMAYTQNNPQESWATFAANMKNGVGKPGYDQGTDCSGFASLAWDIPRQRTDTLLGSGYVYQLSSLSSLLPGDGLNRAYDHVGIFYERLESGNFSMLEQTVPKALRSEWTYSYASTYKPVRRNSIVSSMEPSAPSGSFAVQYFPNQTMSGTPLLTRTEAYPLSHDWGSGGPGSGIPNDGFSLRASGKFYFPAGSYTFNVASDDGVRVWLDGKLIEDHWSVHPPSSYRDEHTLSTGYHTVKVEYFERAGGAVVELRWWKTRTCSEGQFLGEFFSNGYLGGTPTHRTCEGPFNYNWGNGSPASGMPSDDFSVRWEGTFSFQARPYTFIVRSDDGVRVWVDGTLIIDKWQDQPPTEYRVTRTMSAGKHTVLVRYYERGGGAVAQIRWE